MGEILLGNCVLGTIQNGSFVPIGKIDSIEEFEGTTKESIDDNYNTSIKFNNDLSYECVCYMSERSRKNLELLLVYGWNNNMPLRRKLLQKVQYKMFKNKIFNTLNFQINYERSE